MYAVEYLARVGLDHVITLFPEGEHLIRCDDEDAPGGYAAAEYAAELANNSHALGMMLAADPPVPRPGPTNGAKWLGMVITWPDRVPGLKTWAGQSTLPKIIAGHLKRVRGAGPGILAQARGLIRTSKGEGPSGFDPMTCPDPLDAGFSLSDLGADITCRPGLELLAIIGLETVPLVSYAARECGFIHGGRAYRFAVEPRSGGYAYRWGELRVGGPGRADDPANYGTPLVTA